MVAPVGRENSRQGKPVRPGSVASQTPTTASNFELFKKKEKINPRAHFLLQEKILPGIIHSRCALG